ncbi:PEP-utilizing enzyme [Litoricola sp.]|nr:PEP-utilizing enzyme [Litorivicinus sp.]
MRNGGPVLNFNNKAKTLENLNGLVSYSSVLPLVIVSYQEWVKAKRNLSKLLESGLPGWFDSRVIIRSSSAKEDSCEQSLAGHFLSIADVLGLEDIQVAIEKIFESFVDPDCGDIVFIQPFLDSVWISGVAFTFDPSTNSNYYVINYDASSGLTDTITSGRSNDLQTLYILKGQDRSPNVPWIINLVNQLTELEALFGNDKIDVEFAVGRDGVLYILQVRPLVLNSAEAISIDSQLSITENLVKTFIRFSSSKEFIYGKNNIFGIMPDWNPAEIIGIRPKSLALSLYKELITDGTWAFQRHNYGYKNLRSNPLLIDFYGLPYVDVRVSFNSFIPNDIEEALSNKIVDFYLDRLRANPHDHDKVEFNVIQSCYTFDIDERMAHLKSLDFTVGEIDTFKNSLRNLTNKIISQDGLWAQDLKKISVLEERQQKILSNNMPAIDKIYWLIEDCKRYGTLPFAGLARAGFIAVQLLKSLVQTRHISEQDYNQFMSSLNTVGSSLSSDYSALPKEQFLAKYGHLRPGTYDLLSPTYDERPDLYFDWADKPAEGSTSSSQGTYNLSLEQLNSINKLLSKNGINHDVVSLFNFIKNAIEGREFSKFVFTRSLSYALKFIEVYAAECGITKEDSAFIDYITLKSFYSASCNNEELISDSIIKGKDKFAITKSIRLPQLIVCEDDFFHFHVAINAINYITDKKIKGEVTVISGENFVLDNKIVFIPAADPGFDWIFTKGIAGFVTMYGGVNSHMAIRANELGIPAAIGLGEKTYYKYSSSSVIELDCLNNVIRVIR